MIRPDLLGAYVAIVSAGRPGNVPAMTSLVGPATWYVPPDEHYAYASVGARVHLACPRGLTPARNEALRQAWASGAPCIQLSDDLRKLQRAHVPQGGSVAKAVAVTFTEVARSLLEAARVLRAKLAGVAPTANAFYFNPASPLSSAAFIIGDLFAALPCGLFFDEELRLKEDYDYTLQHLRAYGRVARVNSVLATFAHYTNPGGVVGYRSPAEEQKAIALLKLKWPGRVLDNPKRPNEVLLHLPKKRAPPRATEKAPCS